MSLPDYAKPTAGMIIRSIIPASQSVYDIPASYFGIYKLAMGNNTSPVTAGGTLLLFPSAVDYNGVPDDRAGLLIDQYGDVYILSNRNSKWKTLVNTDRTINGYNLSKNVVVNAGDIFSTAKALGNIDLDTLTTPDLYFQSANDNATTARHYPASLAGSLQIYKDAGVTQIYTAYNGGGQWRRGYYNNVWSAWVTAYDSNNLSPVLTVNNVKPDAKGNVKVSTGTTYSNSASKSTNGWFRDSSTGVIRQWGIGALNTTINFPMAFPTACTSIQVAILNSDPDDAMSVHDRTSTSFKPYNYWGNSGMSVIWGADGY
ncbi:hypothetical protein K2B91_000999 [Salmonella enterica subsp. enterica serovar Enteritidis]|nr:hypothetical protein [Salmonella enterica subsp. enterica serovar Enteritidis]EHX6809344.1 hypothetical protein [Salmonella enterica subsp. enterica serovar Enteritidis]